MLERNILMTYANYWGENTGKENDKTDKEK